MGIIERDLFKDIARTLFIMLFILSLVFVVNVLLHVLKYVATGLIGPDVLLQMIGYKVLGKSGLVIPPVYFFAVLWVLSRMYRDNEILALQATGYSQARLHLVVFLLGIPFALFVAWMVMTVLPWSKHGEQLLRVEQSNRIDISHLKARQFHSLGDDGIVVFADSARPGEGLQGVFVQDRQQGRLGLVHASRAYQALDPDTGERHIVLVDGRRYQGDPGKADFAYGEFDEYVMRLPQVDAGDLKLRRSARSSLALMRSAELADRAEFQARLSSVLAVPVFGILGVALARSGPRAGVYGRMVLAVAIYFSFVNLQQVALAWMRKGLTPEWLGLWWVPACMLLVSAVVILSDSHKVNRRLATWKLRWG